MSRFAQRSAPANDQTRARTSVYAQRYSQTGREVQWTPVGEFDDRGQFIAVEGWENRVRGWAPLAEFLEQRR